MKITNDSQVRESSRELKALITLSQNRKLNEAEYLRMCELQKAVDDYCAGAEWAAGV